MAQARRIAPTCTSIQNKKHGEKREEEEESWEEELPLYTISLAHANDANC